MDSKQVKAAFKDVGIKVRVADQGLKFRICTVGDTPFNHAEAKAVAASLGLTSSLAEPGGQINQAHELIGYKPGAIRIMRSRK